MPFEYGNTFERETVGGRDRLRVGLDEAQDACVRELGSGLAGPFQLLYVLHTTRTGSELGRYESPELSIGQVHQFLDRFGPFLSQDARHDFWLRSHDDATIVLDRHNIIHAYGPLATFEAALLRIGLTSSGLPRIPDPHVHHSIAFSGLPACSCGWRMGRMAGPEQVIGLNSRRGSVHIAGLPSRVRPRRWSQSPGIHAV